MTLHAFPLALKAEQSPLRPRRLLAAIMLLSVALLGPRTAGNPVWADEPIAIGTEPQLFIDDYLVDNRYPLQGGHAANHQVLRKFHAPVKHPSNPVFVDPDVITTYQNVRYDREAKLFKMWYGAVYPHVKVDRKDTLPGHYHLRYAESKDGVHWVRPALNIYKDTYSGKPENNICFAHPKFEEMAIKERPGSTPLAVYGVASPGCHFLNEEEMPVADRRGYKYLMTYSIRGGGPHEEDQNQVYLIGSKDGIRWDVANQQSLGMFGISDGWLSILYDSRERKYVAFVRPRDRYHAFQPKTQSHVDFDPRDFIYSGVVRRLARVESDTLWRRWDYAPKIVFLPDEQDLANGANALMSVSMKYHAGIYFGFLKPFYHQKKIWSELTTSRDGKDFERLHQYVLDTGPEGTWDSGQAWASGGWVEVGNEWWLYYFASKRGPNLVVGEGENFNTGRLTIRKEGFLSLNMPASGGMVVTKLLKWPGGDVIVNCATTAGEMRVRISDALRRGVDGFDFKDCAPFTGDSVAHRVKWSGRSLDELAGKEIRLEFYFSRAADLYAFRATGKAR